MKCTFAILFLAGLASCTTDSSTSDMDMENPFFTNLNEPIPFADVTADHIEEYVDITLQRANATLDTIRNLETVAFENVFVPFDEAMSALGTASSHCWMLYWVSTDSLSRVKGLAGYQRLDSMSTAVYADSAVYGKMKEFAESEACSRLEGHRKRLVDDELLAFEQSGVKLDAAPLERYKQLVAEINELTSTYSTNMNTAGEVLILDKEGAAGLPDNFKANYMTEDSVYEIPVMPATRLPVLNNATNEETRIAYYLKYYNRAADKNLDILDSLVQKRHEIGTLMGYDSYAAYNLTLKMAKNPQTVWDFINDLLDRSREKAEQDYLDLKEQRNSHLNVQSDDPVNPWDFNFYKNEILKNRYQVDHEKIREYLPMQRCLNGVFELYQELLGLEFRKVQNPSVWHEEVEMYEVFEGGTLKGRFYLDLFPRPNKESWFYGVPLVRGRMTEKGYEVPVSMLLGNFTRPTDSQPSLLSHSELNTLFHEFGHIIDAMSYDGEFALQAYSRSDFVEAMSQIFENWIWDYDVLGSFAKHYETGEGLPKETVDRMGQAKNLASGLQLQFSLRNCIYDMTLYDKYNPEDPLSTDQIWRNIDRRMTMATYVEGSHPQANWIHINTHPVYYYGYLWSEVYAQDMFTVFEENGLRDTGTGVRYRKLILANGTQRKIEEAVEEFLGRPSNNEAYIRSLGLE